MFVLFKPSGKCEVVKPKAGTDMEKLHDSYVASANMKWYSQLCKTVWQFLTNLNIQLPYDPVIALLGSYPREITS